MKTKTAIETKIYANEWNELSVEITAPNCAPVISSVEENTMEAAIELLAGMLREYSPMPMLMDESNITD